MEEETATQSPSELPMEESSATQSPNELPTEESSATQISSDLPTEENFATQISSELPMEENSATQKENFGKMQHGCEHYKRRCKIRAPCCNQVFPCRHCHNEATSFLSNPKDRHEIVRQDVKQVICSVCDTEQEVARVCSNCGVIMGEYFCEVCKFYDDDIKKQQFHCEDCGICRVGGREKFFHCQKCGSCYDVGLRDKHSCVENAMKHHCPICYEYLFDSVKSTRILNCGHTMHMECYREMAMQHDQFRCPICSKSLTDMSALWAIYDREVKILCNDCNGKSEVFFHFYGHKCSHCNSYNTKQM